jgi:hypothetical protein
MTMNALADPVTLGPWLDSQGLQPGEPLTVTPLDGGRSNVGALRGRGLALGRRGRAGLLRAARLHRMHQAASLTGTREASA